MFDVFDLVAKERIVPVAEAGDRIVLGVGETESHAKRVLHGSAEHGLEFEVSEPHFHRSLRATR